MATVASVGSPQCDRGFILDALLAMNEVPVCKLDKGDVFISLVDPRCISETMEVIQCICKEILSTLDVSAREASLFDRVLRRAIPMVHLGDVDFTSFLRICSTILQAIRVNRAWDPQAQDELIDVAI